MATESRPGDFPPAPEVRTLRLPGGASLVGAVDLPRGMSEQCAVSFNLILQLGPILGSMHCLIGVLRLLGWVIEFVQLVPKVADPTTIKEVLDKLTELPELAAPVLECVAAFTPLGICPPVKDMLVLIRDMLNCVVEFLDSILTQQLEIGVKMGEAQGNPELLEALEVAKNNADVLQQQGMASLEPIFGVLDAIKPFVALASGGAAELPSLDDLTGGELSATIQPLRRVVSTLDAAIAILPC